MSPLVLYDIPSLKGTCMSHNVWKARLVLNYKQIPYRTEWLQHPQIEPTLKSLYAISLPRPKPQAHH